MVPPELLAIAKEGVIPYDFLRYLARSAEVSPGVLLDNLALLVAVRYSNEIMSFEEADTIMNAAFGVSVTKEFFAENGGEIPPAMYEVYEAFDAGEFYHHEDSPEVDPELKYTKPSIAKFLAAQGNGAYPTLLPDC